MTGKTDTRVVGEDRGAGQPVVKRIALTSLLVLVIALSSFTVIDDYAETDLDSLFQRALITFALARTLNGLISAVQGTELALQPAGVGLTLTPGEILDPVNDLVERFSWIMLGATISLGVQQVLLDIGQWWGVRVLVVVLSLALIGFQYWRKSKSGFREKSTFESFLIFTLAAMLFVRFAVPVALIGNEAIYKLFLESRYLESSQELESAGADMEQVNRSEESEGSASSIEPKSKSAFGRFFDSASESLDFESRLSRIKERASDLIGHLIQLSVVFILQTGILPLVFLWLMLTLLRSIFRFGATKSASKSF